MIYFWLLLIPYKATERNIMNRHLLLYIAIFFLLVSWFNTLRHYLRTWIAHLRTKSSVAERKCKNKSFPYPSLTLHKAISLFPCKVEKFRA